MGTSSGQGFLRSHKVSVHQLAPQEQGHYRDSVVQLVAESQLNLSSSPGGYTSVCGYNSTFTGVGEQLLSCP